MSVKFAAKTDVVEKAKRTANADRKIDFIKYPFNFKRLLQLGFRGKAIYDFTTPRERYADFFFRQRLTVFLVRSEDTVAFEVKHQR